MASRGVVTFECGCVYDLERKVNVKLHAAFGFPSVSLVAIYVVAYLADGISGVVKALAVIFLFTGLQAWVHHRDQGHMAERWGK